MVPLLNSFMLQVIQFGPHFAGMELISVVFGFPDQGPPIDLAELVSMDKSGLEVGPQCRQLVF